MSFKRHRRIGAALAALVLIGSLAASGTTLVPMTRAAMLPAPTAVATDTPTPTATTTVALTATATATPTPTATATATPTPTATATATPTPTATATPTPKAALTVTPVTANCGDLVTVSGSGFAAKEIVTIALGGTAATASADASGVLPPTGITIPYSLKSALYTVTATGATSKRSASAAVTVHQLTPSIALSMAQVSPGTTATVTGKGFGPTEQVTLALNGAALPTLPRVINTTNGAFTAAFTVPRSLLNGTNTVSAIGNESRVSAVAPLTGQLPVAAQFYFAGVVSTATEQSFIDLLNPLGQPTDVQLTFFFANGATDTKAVTLGPTSVKDLSVAGLEPRTGTFGLAVKADRQIGAQITLTRPGQDGDTLQGNTGPDTRWYLAEGYTGPTFHETVAILNSDVNAPAHVTLHLLPFRGHARRDVPVTVPPHATSVTDINRLLPGRALSIFATSDRPVVVERTLTFGKGGYGMTTSAGTNTPATTWIFAEGTTVNGLQTFLTILNPNTIPTHVTASFFGRTGEALGNKTIVVAGLSRTNIKLNDFLNASGIASVLTSDMPIVAERSEYFGAPTAPRIAGSDVFGSNGAGVSWSFPGGDTVRTSEFLLLYNPSAVTIPVDATFYGTNGLTATKRIVVPPTVRFNVNVNTLIPGFAPLHGVVLQSASDEGFVAEQTIFAPDRSTLRSSQGLAQ
jgi:hypothetical protein